MPFPMGKLIKKSRAAILPPWKFIYALYMQERRNMAVSVLSLTAINLTHTTMFSYMSNIPVENKFALRLFAQLIEQMCNKI